MPTVPAFFCMCYSRSGDRRTLAKEVERTAMNDSEMRRRELLRQTRKMYGERRDIPAVHPRYGRIYQELYGNEKTQEKQTGEGSFYLRLVIGILCFICFVYMDQSQAKVAEVDSTAITNQIEKDMDVEAVKEVWKEFQ